MKRYITTECVAWGHPDKVADQISDAILDAYLSIDTTSKVAVETMVKDNTVVLGGEVKSKAIIDYDSVIRNLVKEIGYTDAEHGFYYKNLTIINLIGKQSPEINSAVEISDEEVTSGDQGFMVGYATDETPNYMPLGSYLSRKIVDAVVSISGKYFDLGPDAKSQVTIEEDGDNRRVESILISTMHSTEISLEELRNILTLDFIKGVVGLDIIDENTKLYINPAGSWNVGGPVSDCGITGRKIVVDQYGPYCPVGGGAFSGKDSSKTDRSGAYLARYIAKNIVANKLAKKCKVEISYMIGVAEPSSINIDTYGTGDDIKLIELVKEKFPVTPSGIVKLFDMNRPIYRQTAICHFGNENNPWEQIIKL